MSASPGFLCMFHRLQIKMGKYRLPFHRNPNRSICRILDKRVRPRRTAGPRGILSRCQQPSHLQEINPKQQGSSRGSCWPLVCCWGAKTKPSFQAPSKKVHRPRLSGHSHHSLPKTPSSRPSGNPRRWRPAPYTPCTPSTRLPGRTSSRRCRAR